MRQDSHTSRVGEDYPLFVSWKWFHAFQDVFLSAHASNPENRFTLFGMRFWVSTHLIRKPFHTFRDRFLSAHASYPKTVSHFSGWVFERPRILSENRFTLFGMSFWVPTHLVRKPFHTFRDEFLNAHASYPKTVSHFSGWVFECPRILSENRFTLFGMRGGVGCGVKIRKNNQAWLRSGMRSFWPGKIFSGDFNIGLFASKIILFLSPWPLP